MSVCQWPWSAFDERARGTHPLTTCRRGTDSQSEAPSYTHPLPPFFASDMSGISGLARAACASSTSRRVRSVSRSSSSFRGGRLAKAPATTIRGTAPRSRRGVTRAVLRDGQLVTIHYVMKFPDGTVGDDTRVRDAPATLPIGQGQLFPQLEKGIAQMEVGEKKTFKLTCAEAYGEGLSLIHI